MAIRGRSLQTSKLIVSVRGPRAASWVYGDSPLAARKGLYFGNYVLPAFLLARLFL
jgi:hypothetical protein